MLAALPTAPLFCRERANGALRLILPRSGRTGCPVGVHLAPCSAGDWSACWDGLFGLCCLLLFPPAAAYGMAVSWQSVLPYLGGAFFLGASSVNLAVALCSVSHNPYQVLCGSFTLFYTLSAFCTRVNSGLQDSTGLPYLLAITGGPCCARWQAPGMWARTGALWRPGTLFSTGMALRRPSSPCSP